MLYVGLKTQKSISAMAVSRTRLVELTVLPIPNSWTKPVEGDIAAPPQELHTRLGLLGLALRCLSTFDYVPPSPLYMVQ